MAVTTGLPGGYTARLVFKGDPYGFHLHMTHMSREPLVEFYDNRVTPEQGGNYLGRYLGRYPLSYLMGWGSMAVQYDDTLTLNDEACTQLFRWLEKNTEELVL